MVVTTHAIEDAVATLVCRDVPWRAFRLPANDWIDGKRHLRRLLDEGKAIAPVTRAGLDVLPAFHNATVADGDRAAASARIRLLRFAAAGMASPSPNAGAVLARPGLWTLTAL